MDRPKVVGVHVCGKCGGPYDQPAIVITYALNGWWHACKACAIALTEMNALDDEVNGQ